MQEAGFSSAHAVKNQLSHLEDDRWALARVMLTDQSVPFLEQAVGRATLPLSRLVACSASCGPAGVPARRDVPLTGGHVARTCGRAQCFLTARKARRLRK